MQHVVFQSNIITSKFHKNMFLPNLKLIVHVIQSIFEIINRIIIMRINIYKYFFKTTFYLSLYEREHVLDNVSNKISF